MDVVWCIEGRKYIKLSREKREHKMQKNDKIQQEKPGEDDNWGMRVSQTKGSGVRAEREEWGSQ